MNWDDLRYVLALAKAGSLAKAAKELKVDHTTVGRRIEALESDLDVRLFARTTSGYALTQEAEALLPELAQVEAAVFALERSARARDECLEGAVRITSPESFGAHYLAPRLARLAELHPALSIELMTGASVFDLARREADVAVRVFRSKHDHLVVRRAGDIAQSLYATPGYLAKRRTPKTPADLAGHDILTSDPDPMSPEAQWFLRVARGARVAFVTNLTLALRGMALAGAGIAVLPCYMGDAEPGLRRLPMPDEPSQPLWLTVHRDLQHTRRVRAVLDFLYAMLQADKALLTGAASAARR